MAENQSGRWDEEEGYSFSKEDSEKKRVPLPSSDRPQSRRGRGKGREKRKRGGKQKRRKKRGRGNRRKGKSEEPVIRDRMDFDKMHPEFPDTHDYLQDSLKDIDFMGERIKAMRRDRQRDDDEEKVTIRKRPQHENENRGRVAPEEIEEEVEQSREARRRRVRNRAIGKVIRHLKEEGYSQEFIRENRDVIREKVDEFLFNRDRSL